MRRLWSRSATNNLDDIWKGANSAQRPPTIAREDAFIGPFMDVFLHEAPAKSKILWSAWSLTGFSDWGR